MTSTILAWAIKAPDGGVFTDSVSHDEGTAKRRFLNEITMFYSVWRVAERDGYRCVRVRVEEIENPKDKTCNLADCEVADKSSKKCKKCMAAGVQASKGSSDYQEGVSEG
jgi:hypothetical protein